MEPAAGSRSDARLSDEDAQLNAMSGFGGAYGGLFSSTVMVVMQIFEVARPGGQRFAKALVGSIVASSVSFGIYFAIAGAVFLDAYQVPPYALEDWQLLAAIPLGLLAAVVVTVLVVFVQGAARLFELVKLPGIVRTTLGGVVFGVVSVALPLTMFTGSAQLTTGEPPLLHPLSLRLACGGRHHLPRVVCPVVAGHALPDPSADLLGLSRSCLRAGTGLFRPLA